MKILLVTGRLAKEQVKAYEKKADVLVADVNVAAFITPQMLLSAAPVGYDLILIPGAITADFRDAERTLGTRILLGPKHAADIGEVLRHLERDDLELSRTVPACQMLGGGMRTKAAQDLERLEVEAQAASEIGGIKIGGGSRMKVLAEVVDATRLSSEELSRKVKSYERDGADMIDLGLPLDARPEDVKAAIDSARRATNLPVSIDTVRPDLLMAGIRAGADLLLSLNADNIPLVGRAAAEAGVPAVVIPGPGTLPLEQNLKEAEDLGIRAFADPVLDPPMQGLASSLERYLHFNRAHPEVPLFFGAGNVTELMDADSQGVNALLAALGAEAGAAILFTPEYSAKAAGSIRELATASRMMQLAGFRKTPPKDLGEDLLVLKEKRRPLEEMLPQTLIEAGSGHRYEPDNAGAFRIYLSGGLIIAQNGSVSVSGANARDLLNTLIEMGLVSRLDHAGYLGRELERAEIALRLKRGYIQDEPLWPPEKS